MLLGFLSPVWIDARFASCMDHVLGRCADCPISRTDPYHILCVDVTAQKGHSLTSWTFFRAMKIMTNFRFEEEKNLNAQVHK